MPSKGAVIVDIQAGCPVQADDIALVSSNELFIQATINICIDYSRKWKSQFSDVKSQIMLCERPTEINFNFEQ